jgi:hypothetical protein
MKNKPNKLLYHIALWLPILFITPLIIASQNPDDFAGGLWVFALSLFVIVCVASLITWLLLKAFKANIQYALLSIILGIATVLVIQGYIVHGLFEYGQLDGKTVDWRSFGYVYWLEVGFFVLAIVLFSVYYFRSQVKWSAISWVLILFAMAQLALVMPQYFSRNTIAESNGFNPSVYEFSSTSNIIHILADGFQADIVKQVLDENPELTKAFSGFNFFENHLGRFQSTAPTIPSIYTGEFFDLNQGYKARSVQQDIAEHAYTNVLSDNGYRLDFVGVSKIYCHKNANSCVNLSFNDLKARGYTDHKTLIGSLALLLDIGMFRHTPMYLKEKIYNNGSWLISTKVYRDWSKYPDPVIREWTEHMKVATTTPVYKWYHFIGTHIPAQWSSQCEFLGRQPQSREFYKDQTFCILADMANLFNQLKAQGIYDITTIIINGDHGCNIAANDVFGSASNTSIFHDAFLGVSRPVFMFKKPNQSGQLTYNDAPTTLIDIAPTILDVMALPHDNYPGISAFNKSADNQLVREFHRYHTKRFWNGKPISYNEYSVTGNIRDRSNWKVVAMHNRDKAPSFYEHMDIDTAGDFSLGLSLWAKHLGAQTQSVVYGKEFFILLSDLKTKAKKLVVKLKIPAYSKEQKLSVFINGTQIVSNSELKPIYNIEFTHEINIPEGLLQTENNLFKFEFANAGLDSNNKPRSAVIRSISLQ